MSLTAKPRTPTHAKKRQAGHHRQNKGYLKTYWPYIPMVAIIGAGVFMNTMLSSTEAVLGTQSNYASSSFLSLTNAARLSDHEGTLDLNSDLSSAAQAKANDMATDNYWSHTSPSGKTAEDFIIDSGYQFTIAGENLAYGFSSASSVMSAWMNSPEHKANILDADYKDVGFGVADASNYLGKGPKVIVVAEYAEPTSDTGVLGLSVKQPPLENVSRLDSLTSTNATWPEIFLTIFATTAVVTIFFKHGLGFRKLVFESEEYIIKHPMLDILIVFLGTAAVVLGHTGGLIG